MPDSLRKVAANVIACERCPRLRSYCKRVAQEKRRMFQNESYWGKPVPGFGDPEACLLIIGLAPAAHGGNRTGRVFTGDRSGDWLYDALYRYGFANQPVSKHRNDGLQLKGAYVTAAARCAPPANKPERQEFANCREYLVRELRLLPQVQVILCLGRLALDNYLLARTGHGHSPTRPRPAFAHGAEWAAPEGVTVLCSYHPSQQNTQTGKLTRQMFHSVFSRAREICENS
ncbi:MAG TPA: uracil-DNA glycosylase [Acidobacteriota bacterium]|jgi:uracil-DNA glycosylase family 4